MLLYFLECIRRVQKHDVTDVFNINDTREPTVQPDETSINENYQLPPYDPPPAYSSLFPLQKDFNTTVNPMANSAPSSIFIASVTNPNSTTSPITVFTTANVTLPHRNSFMNTISRISSSISFARNISSNNINNLYRTRQYSENGTGQNPTSHPRNHTQSESQAQIASSLNSTNNIAQIAGSLNSTNNIANMASNSSVLRIARSNATLENALEPQGSSDICNCTENLDNITSTIDDMDDNCGIVIGTRIRPSTLTEHSDV